MVQNNKGDDVKNPIIPILLIFALFALGIVGYQVFRLVVAQNVSGEIAAQTGGGERKTGNVFKDMAFNHPKNEVARRNQTPLQQSYNALPYDHNIQLGNEFAKIRLTVFTDVACGSCRADVNRVLQNVPLQDVRVVFKHASRAEDDIKSGLFEQIAREAGVLKGFHSAVYAQGGDVSDEFMMTTLQNLGVTYQMQREMLKDEPGSITRLLDKDLAQGGRAGIRELPTFFLNRYRMGDKTLPTENIGEYVMKLKNSQPIFAVGG